MDFVTCPHCGQMQALASDGKCIKCKEDIKNRVEKNKKISFTNICTCPECHYIQSGENEYCEKCHTKMDRKGSGAKWCCLIFGITSLIFFALVLKDAYFLWVDTSGFFSPDEESLEAAILMFLFNLVIFILSRLALSAPPQKRVKAVKTIYPFCNIDGISGVDFSTSGSMKFSEDNQEICFSVGEHFSRSVGFDQIIGISFGSYNYEQLKSFVGGMSIGNVYIHESPVSQKSKPFFQIRYVSSEIGRGEGIIRVIFSDWTNLSDLEFLTSWIGMKMDPEYVLESHKRL